MMRIFVVPVIEIHDCFLNYVTSLFDEIVITLREGSTTNEIPVAPWGGT